MVPDEPSWTSDLTSGNCSHWLAHGSMSLDDPRLCLLTPSVVNVETFQTFFLKRICDKSNYLLRCVWRLVDTRLPIQQPLSSASSECCHKPRPLLKLQQLIPPSEWGGTLTKETRLQYTWEELNRNEEIRIVLNREAAKSLSTCTSRKYTHPQWPSGQTCTSSKNHSSSQEAQAPGPWGPKETGAQVSA